MKTILHSLRKFQYIWIVFAIIITPIIFYVNGVQALRVSGSVVLIPGMNLLSLPVNMLQAPDVDTWIDQVGGAEVIDRVERINLETGLFESCIADIDNNSGNACLLPLTTSEGWVVYAHQEKTVIFDVELAPDCTNINLVPGVNLAGFPCIAEGVTSYSLLDSIGNPDAIAGVQAFDTQSGRWLSTVYDQFGQASGDDFAINAVSAYLVHTTGSVVWIPGDTDEDGLNDAIEQILGTDPNNPDTDGDGLLDGEEVNQHGTDPNKIDTDGDQFDDAAEIAAPSDPLDAFDTPIGNFPPDPSILAPPLDMTITTTLYDSVSFLFDGPNPIQTGVVPGTIEARRTGVLRGKVLNRNGAGIPGVTVSIHHFSKFGSTLTRLDGMFDLVVNGGGYLTIQFEKDGFLPVHRTLHIPWQEYAMVDDIVMINLDPEASVIDFSDTIQVHRAGMVEDVDGQRQATLMFRQGTVATMELPDGSTQQLPSITVRATEYTVGDSGPAAMPADLPPASWYTYALSYNVEEADALDAKSVSFDPAAISYTENFGGAPVGTIMPAGSYDNDKAAWLPQPNGKVIKILNIANDLALLDVDGEGVQATPERLAELDITDAERQKLTELYNIGQELWRVPMTHFSSWDINVGWAPIAGSENPDGEVDVDDECNGPCSNEGSIIEAQNQVMRQEIEVVGTPFTLNYGSNRVQGFSEPYRLNIKLSDEPVEVPPFYGVLFSAQIHGRVLTSTAPYIPGLTASLLWDGLGPYGRRLQGPRAAKICISFIYPIVWVTPYNVGELLDAFGYSGNGVNIGSMRGGLGDRVPITICLKPSDAGGGSSGSVFPGYSSADYYQVGGFNAKDSAAHLAGWTLSEHHTLAPDTGILYMGDGRVRDSAQGTRVIDTYAGRGSRAVVNNEAVPAKEATIPAPRSMAFAPDGALFVTTRHQVVRISPDGIATSFAGLSTSTSAGFSGDGGLATDAMLSSPRGIDVGPDGSVYIADWGNRRVRKVDTNGIITTIAGNGTHGFEGNEGPALNAQLTGIKDVAVAPDNTVYLLQEAGTNGSMLRRLTPDGIIRTITTRRGCPDDFKIPHLIVETCLKDANAITLGPDGSIFVAEGDPGSTPRIRKISPAGIITLFAGGGAPADGVGDGLLATEARLAYPKGVSVSPDGAVYIYSGGLSRLHRIRYVADDGIMRTLAGTGDPGFSGDGGAALAAEMTLNNNGDVIYGPDHAIYMASATDNVIRRISNNLEGYTAATDIGVPSEDGSELFIFNADGRHLKTLNTLTGALIWDFGYDAEGYLVSVTDGYGAVTRIDRTQEGMAFRIVGPDGQMTFLQMGINDYIGAIVNPANERRQFEYTSLGLMERHISPLGHSSSYEYDLFTGRLLKAIDPEGGFQTYSREQLDGRAYEVTRMTAEGRVTKYRLEQLRNGTQLRQTTLPDGQVIEASNQGAAQSDTILPDGTKISILRSPDPRFGMQAPLLAKTTLTLPSGLELITQETQPITEFAQGQNLLSVTRLVNENSINGRTWQDTYTANDQSIRSVSPEGRTQTIEINAQLDPLSLDIPGISSPYFSYDERGRLELISQGFDADARVYQLSYDNDGYVNAITDPENHVEAYDYDQVGRTTKVTLPDLREINYTYDINGNLLSITPPGRPGHAFSYDNIDLTAAYEPPVGQPYRYLYNDDQQLTKVTYPSNQVAELFYFPNGRVRSLVLPEGTYTHGYNQDTGQLQEVTDPTGNKLIYTHDGVFPRSEQWQGLINGKVSNTYNTDFTLREQSINDLDTVGFSYDNDGLLTAAGQLNYTRNPENGLMTDSSLGDVSTQVDYNSFGDIEHYGADYQGTVLYSATYQKDKLDRITQKTEMLQGVTTTVTYDYDLSGQLSRVVRDGLPTTYRYDNNGNRLSVQTASGTTSATYNILDQIVQFSNRTYTHSLNGNLNAITVAGQQTNLVYDLVGNLRRIELPNVGVIEYEIDASDRRIGKRKNGFLVQGFLYDGQINPVAELDASGNVVSRFVYGLRDNVPEYFIKGGNTYRLITDHIGSVRLVVDIATGNVVQRMDHSAFGEVLVDTNPGFQPFGFAGGLYDPDTGLVRFGARDYDPLTGRWTAPDPIGHAGEDVNLYLYVDNDPVNLVDPSGLFLNILAGCVLGGATELGLQLLTNGGETDCIDWTDVAIETGLGCVGAGLFSKLSKIRKLNKVKACRSSFTTGTLVHAKDGLKPIETISVGDWVLSYDEQSKTTGYQPVTQVVQREHLQELIIITLDSEQKLKVTSEHPFYVEGKGWYPARQLSVGLAIKQHNGQTINIKALDISDGTHTVHNLTVARTHNYFVGTDGLLVHNGICRNLIQKIKDFFTPKYILNERARKARRLAAAKRRLALGGKPLPNIKIVPQANPNPVNVDPFKPY